MLLKSKDLNSPPLFFLSTNFILFYITMNDPQLEKLGMSIKTLRRPNSESNGFFKWTLLTFFGRSKLNDTARRHVSAVTHHSRY